MLRKEAAAKAEHMAGAWGPAATRASKRMVTTDGRPMTTSSLGARPSNRLPPEALVERFTRPVPALHTRTARVVERPRVRE